ncbi:MAG TPA: Gfo/Idh/MocA family oxidoreductase [Alphaproteobacteria bacterium]|nr:Gfo/Idh/MocA family oxidoreductase [Alphaproteobacteria bacterium]
MSGKLRIGIAGYGVVGKRRRHFIDLHPGLKTVAVCDQTFGNEGGNGGVRHHVDYQTLLGEDLDALFVCMPNDTAPDVVIAGLGKGLHVFCEKPPGRNLGDVARVIATEREHPGLKLQYGFNHRYHDSVRDALAILRSGELGRVINIKGVYGKSKFVSFAQKSDWRIRRDAAGGGILLDQGIHMVDLMRLFGGEFTEVHSFVSNDYWKHDVEDNAYALMRTEDGVVAMLHSSATQWRHRFELDVTCEKGALVLSGILSGSKSYGVETLSIARAAPDDDTGDPAEETRHYENDPSWADEIAEFADAVLNDRKITNGSSKEAFDTMQLVFRIYCADGAWAEKWGLSDEAPDAR